MSTIYVYTHIYAIHVCICIVVRNFYTFCSKVVIVSTHTHIYMYILITIIIELLFTFSTSFDPLSLESHVQDIKLLTRTKCASALLQRCHMDLKHPLPSHSHSYSSGSLLTPTVPEYEGIMHPSALHFTTHFSQFILVSVPTYI